MSICEKATAKSIIDADWNLPESISENSDAFQIRQVLYSLCDPLEADGKIELAQVAALIGHISGLVLQFVDPKVPFREINSSGSFRTLNLSDLTLEHLEILKEVEKRTANLFLKARLNDVLWLKVRPFNRSYAEAAVQSYLSLALKISAQSNTLFYSKNYTLRAINIWRELGSQSEMRIKIEETLLKCMRLENPEPRDATRLFFYDNLSECFDEKEADKWIALGDELIKSARDQKEFEKARKYNVIQRRFYRAKKDKASILNSRKDEVHLFIEEAKEKRVAGASPTITQHFLNKAFEAARNTPGMTQEAKQLKAEMVDVQTSIPATFKEFATQTIDLRTEIEAIQARMQDRGTRDCIQMIAEVTIPGSKKELYQRAEEHLKGNPIQSFIAMQFLDEKGKLIARRPGAGRNSEEMTAAFRAEATQSIQHSLAVRGTILSWMRREVCNRSDAQDDIFDFLLYPNPFVPYSRILQYRQGLHRGLAGDWISCISILVPQLENSLRTILHLSGVDMISIDSDGIQQEKDLNTFIYGEEFKAIFGEDMAFQLQVLLTDKIGFNIRNQVAHGLLTDARAVSEIGPAIWSITLLLCISVQRAFTASEAEKK